MNLQGRFKKKKNRSVGGVGRVGAMACCIVWYYSHRGGRLGIILASFGIPGSFLNNQTVGRLLLDSSRLKGCK